MNASNVLLPTPDTSANAVSGPAAQKYNTPSPSQSDSDTSNVKAPFDRVLDKQIKERSSVAKNADSANDEPQDASTVDDTASTESSKIQEEGTNKPTSDSEVVSEVDESLVITTDLEQMVNILEQKTQNQANTVAQQITAEKTSAEASKATPVPVINGLNSMSSESDDTSRVDEKALQLAASQNGGKVIPPGGKNLPEGHMLDANAFKAGNPSNSNPIADYINKSVDYSQQLLKASDGNIELPSTTQSSSASLLNLDTSNLGISDKTLNPRIGNLNGIESSTGLYPNSKVGSQEWAADVGNRIRWMGKVNITSAELQLHPAELGSMEIKITTKDDQSTVSFVTSNAAAKELVEASLPKLKELLANSGLQLAQSDVSQHSSSENNGEASDTKNRQGDLISNETDTNEENNPQIVKEQGLGQIDHYV